MSGLLNRSLRLLKMMSRVRGALQAHDRVGRSRDTLGLQRCGQNQLKRDFRWPKMDDGEKGWAQVWTVPNALTTDMCDRWIALGEKGKWDRHGISKDDPATRSATKAKVDIDLLLPIVRSVVPARIFGRHLLRIPHERMIFIRYGVGDKFGVHTDAPYRPAPHCKSLYTLMVYLNDDYEGGETRFPGLKRVVRPETGMVLIFPHRLRHEGLMVTRGTKYALHTFILYNKP